MAKYRWHSWWLEAHPEAKKDCEIVRVKVLTDKGCLLVFADGKEAWAPRKAVKVLEGEMIAEPDPEEEKKTSEEIPATLEDTYLALLRSIRDDINDVLERRESPSGGGERA